MEKKNLEDKRAELRNKERELQDIEEKHQVRIDTRNSNTITLDIMKRCGCRRKRDKLQVEQNR